MIDDKDTRYLATNLKGLFQDMLEWMEERNAALRAGSGLGQATPAEAKLFATLRGRERSIADLARVLGVSRQAIHHTVHRLVEHGVVELVPSEASGREKLVRITAAGRSVQTLAARNLRKIEAELARSIGRENVTLIRELLVAHLERVGTIAPARR